jgi:predicted CxxxxCH...CXXCH cytochrome family protein
MQICKMPITAVALVLSILALIGSGCGSGTDSDSISGKGSTSSITSSSCLVCHSSQFSSLLDPLLTNGSGTAGKHVLHVNTRGIECLKCHQNYLDQTTHLNGTMDTGNPAIHLVLFDATNQAGAWINDTGTATGACSSLACHGPQVPDWYGTASTLPDCTTCHTGSLDPSNTNGSGTAGKHVLHVNTRTIGCLKCHLNYTSQTTHMNGTKDTADPAVRLVSFDVTNPTGTWINDTGAATGTCSSLACHGPQVPDWYGASSALPACSVCHTGSYDPIYLDPNGKHQQHYDLNQVPCQKCHSGYTDHLTHMNGAWDTSNPASLIYFDSTNQYGQWTASATCSATYCHNGGNSPSMMYYNYSPAWTGTFEMACNTYLSNVSNGIIQPCTDCHSNTHAYSCDTCHGATVPAGLTKPYSAPTPHQCYRCHGFPPTYSTTLWYYKANSHYVAPHRLVTCNACHVNTTSNGITISNFGNHTNGVYNVAPDKSVYYPDGTSVPKPVNFTYTPNANPTAGGTCSNISCHFGSAKPTTIQWGSQGY